MGIDIFSWATGFALTTAMRRLGGKLTSADVEQNLRSELHKWSETLPSEMSLHADALFLGASAESGADVSPNLVALRQSMQTGTIPDTALWHAALVERWRAVRQEQGDEAQAFFQVAEDEASDRILELADRLRDACIKHEELFKSHVVAQLAALASQIANESDIPDPASLSGENAAQCLAQCIEHETPWRVHVAFIDQQTRTLVVWGRLLNDERPMPKPFLHAACVASGCVDVDTIKVGLSNIDDIGGSDASGSIGGFLVVFQARSVERLARTKEVPQGFWSDVSIEVLKDPNGCFQEQVRIPFNEVDVFL